jgi:hypothetical protein
VQSATAEQGNQRRTDQYGNIGRAPYLMSGDGAEGRPGRVEEERLLLGDGRPGRRRLTPGRTAGEGSGATGNSATLGLARDGSGKGNGGGVLCSDHEDADLGKAG